MKFNFTVFGTSGIVFPWSPPLIGILLQVLIQYPYDEVVREVAEIHFVHSKANPEYPIFTFSIKPCLLATRSRDP
jgi:hypothetical protein